MGFIEQWSDQILANTTTAGDQTRPAIAALSDGRFVAMWTDLSQTGGDLSGAAVRGQIFNGDGTKAGGEFLVNTSTLLAQEFPQIAALDNGGFVAVWRNANPPGVGNDHDVVMQVFNKNGAKIGTEIIPHGVTAHDQSEPAIATLKDGRFIVTWTDDSLGSQDIRASIFNPDGSPSGGNFGVNVQVVGSQANARVAKLENGGFVVTWEQEGGASDAIHARIFDQNGDPVGGDILVNTGLTGNRSNDSIVGLADGRFVVAWNEGADNFGAHAQIFSATGQRIGDELVLNDEEGPAYGTDLTALDDGGFLATWHQQSPPYDSFAIRGRSFTTDGVADRSASFIGVVTHKNQGTFGNPVTTLADGRIVTAWTSESQAFGDGSGIGISLIISDPRNAGIERLGTDLNDQYYGSRFADVLKGGGGADKLFGAGGNDILNGGPGGDFLSGGNGFDTATYAASTSGVTVNLATTIGSGGDASGDTLVYIEKVIGSDHNDVITGNLTDTVLQGGLGNDKLNGKSGYDTAVFTQDLDAYKIHDLGAKILVIGAEGQDTLTGIDRLEFKRGALEVVDDGNPLFDALFYYSQNFDVFGAGVDALSHFNTSGRHEGRDPNGWFDTSGYLAANKDVAASGMNPLDHYHLIGWKEGRDPSAFFDTTLYLLRNPDVAAAGIDPLAHFLAVGHSEGRQAYMAIGPVVNGFDAQHYLFDNPDVAAAEVDPLLHYNTIGWQEGRNPNAWFDSAGYLAHNPDVAAAGINPLWHYQTTGWTEGRDPSARFDTLKYLAANPDVAAAGLNPLDHFLQHGVYEGRANINDGMWS